MAGHREVVDVDVQDDVGVTSPELIHCLQIVGAN